MKNKKCKHTFKILTVKKINGLIFKKYIEVKYLYCTKCGYSTVDEHLSSKNTKNIYIVLNAGTPSEMKVLVKTIGKYLEN